ncbi:MAG: hypothetical protein ABIH38_01455 [Patescibacteria group bacterium]
MNIRRKRIILTLSNTLIFLFLGYIFSTLGHATDMPHKWGLPFWYFQEGSYMIGGPMADVFRPLYLILDFIIFLIPAYLLAYRKYRK